MNEPGRYRKKPVVVDAMRFDGNHGAIEEWASALSGITDHSVFGGDMHGLTVHTLEGDMRAGPGDWIIRGVHGEFYPCKPDIFEQTYEEATDE